MAAVHPSRAPWPMPMIRETLACPYLEPDARSAHDLPFRVALALVNGETLMSPALVARSALAVLLSAPLSATPAVVAPQHERPNAVPTAAVYAAGALTAARRSDRSAAVSDASAAVLRALFPDSASRAAIARERARGAGST